MPSPVDTPFQVDESRLATCREALSRWYRTHARDLPWRRDRAPYRVWVSEVMLQQTRVDTVVPYFARFLARFPDIPSLAAASEEEVLEAWSGLGYYRRARFLREGARRVMREYDGRFPTGEREVLSIPGIGRYAAGAIRSIAFGIRAPVLDGNVTRVLSRIFGVRGDPARLPAKSDLWDLAGRMVEAGSPGEINQAQMEFGALQCVPAAPACDICPVSLSCTAFAEGRVAELPELSRRRKTVAIERVALLVRRGPEVLLRRRPESELLPGLWDLPGAFEGDDARVAAGAADAAGLLPHPVEVGETLGVLRHAVTHRRIRLTVRRASPGGWPDGPAPPGTDGARLRWVLAAEAEEVALSAPGRAALRRWPDQGTAGGSPP
ncbi:MAG: A/G-specific adenine glycosylase [Gemmatimonadota bacterium]|nr:A/G-specific adenine glycosylase [Gemmatimonadota bacterium]